MSNIIDTIQLSGVTYTIQGSGGGNPTVELTQAQYDALVTAGTVATDTYYIITDAQPTDISQYWTSAQTQSAITSAVSTKQDTLVSGTNIKTINNESILGSGNIDIQGGGKAIEAGRGISITTGETADTVSLGFPIWGGGSFDSNVKVCSENNTFDGAVYSFASGTWTKVRNRGEFASGRYNTSNYGSGTFGNSGNTLFSVGNGTADNARHNAFEIRENGDIYLNDGTNDVKLQDYLQIKAVKVTQAEYDALVSGGTVDPNTLYIITNVVS